MPERKDGESLQSAGVRDMSPPRLVFRARSNGRAGETTSVLRVNRAARAAVRLCSLPSFGASDGVFCVASGPACFRGAAQTRHKISLRSDMPIKRRINHSESTGQ